jgi:hypothetical protein
MNIFAALGSFFAKFVAPVAEADAVEAVVSGKAPTAQELESQAAAGAAAVLETTASKISGK